VLCSRERYEELCRQRAGASAATATATSTVTEGESARDGVGGGDNGGGGGGGAEEGGSGSERTAAAAASGSPLPAPLARVLSYADASQDPLKFTTSPALAVRKALDKAGLDVGDIDFWEVNEAFSVVDLANRHLLSLDPSRVNVRGGAVALGHPLGCSGARILVTLLHVMRDKGVRRGCAAVCHGGGGATAIVVERVD
jgi:acetyl-CoA C-acetyltransferase